MRSSDDAEDPRAVRSPAALVKLAVGLALAVAGAYFVAGPLEEITLPEASAQLRDLGPKGVVLFLAIFAVVQPLGVSSHLFTFTATLVWGQPRAFLLTWVGATLATMTAFGFARYVARDWVQQNLPARFRDLDDRLQRSAFRTLFWLRTVFWCAPPVGFAAGVSRVNGMTHHLASALGCIPQVFLSSLLAHWLGEKLREGNYSVGSILTAVTVLVVVVVAAFFLGRRLLRRRPARPASGG